MFNIVHIFSCTHLSVLNHVVGCAGCQRFGGDYLWEVGMCKKPGLGFHSRYEADGEMRKHVHHSFRTTLSVNT